MKKQTIKFFLFLLLIGLLPFSGFAQAPPQAISYQAVARDNNGNIISNKTVSLRFSIHDLTANGATVYQETQSATTNVLGLVNLSIGTGTVVSGTFVGINWGSGAKYLQVEIDPTGGSTYTSLGTSQMLSVPYALYAANGGGSGGATGDSVLEVYGTGSLTVTSSTAAFTPIPGLSATVNVPANSKILVHTEGAVATSALNASGFSSAMIGILLDGVYVGPGGERIVIAENNTGLNGVFVNYSFDKTYDSAVIGVGSHSFSANALYIQGSTSNVCTSNATPALQGVLRVTILKQ